jgi:hypothetical protein
MFTDLENEIVRILRANLSSPNVNPALVPTDRIITGPIDPPTAGQFPTVAFTAGSFTVLPESEGGPPRGVKAAVAESFSPNGAGPFPLSRPPLEPLRAVEVEETPTERQLLRERDDYTVDYVNEQVRLRRPLAGNLHIQYFTLQPLRVVAATGLRITGKLEIWASVTAGEPRHLDIITPIAVGALSANAAGIDGLLSTGQNVVDSGLASLGTQHVFLIFEGLRPIGGAQPEPTKWEINYNVDATLVLTPADEEIGVMRYIATGITWDDRLAEAVLAATPPILNAAVTIIQGVGAVTAAGLADLGITTVGQLAHLAPTGQPLIDAAIPRAQTARDRAHTVVRDVVQAGPAISDVAVFLNTPLADIDAGDLTAIDIPAETAAEIVAALTDLRAQLTTPTPRLSDLFFISAV